MAAGKIYDVDELSRVKGWADLQEQQFENADRESDKKETIIQAIAVVVGAVVIIAVIHKLTKK